MFEGSRRARRGGKRGPWQRARDAGRRALEAARRAAASVRDRLDGVLGATWGRLGPRGRRAAGAAAVAVTNGCILLA
ncbi:MAG: hypothetical protein ABEJ46_03955, partial [Gemmatimonadota bacterium]